VAQRADATVTPFTLAVVPDIQYEAGTCPAQYADTLEWIVGNQALSVNGVSLNTKGVVSVGDCVNNAGTGSGEITVAAAAQTSTLDAHGYPFEPVPGNHDYQNSSLPTRTTLGAHFMPGGIYGPDVRAAQSYWGGVPGGGGSSQWGGAYNDPATGGTTGANTWIEMIVGSRKFLVIGLEFFPRSSVLVWAKTIHDAYPDHEVIVSTHSFITDQAHLVTRTTDAGYSAMSSVYGPDDYSLGASPASNSGSEMWLNYLQYWPRLRFILCGHWIYANTNTGGPNLPWYWNLNQLTAADGHTVNAVFTDAQELDNTGGAYCPSGTPNGTSNVAHMFLMRWDNTPGMCEAFMVSTNSGKWVGANAAAGWSSSPVQLFNVADPAITPTPSFNGSFTGSIL
jgi:hypothetical protein